MDKRELTNKKTRNYGFTLFEVILALALAGASVAVLATSYMQSAHTQKNVANRITAMVLGAGKLAELEQGAEPTLAGLFAEPFDKFKWTAKEESLKDGSSNLELTVEWKEGGGYNPIFHQITLKGFRLPQ